MNPEIKNTMNLPDILGRPTRGIIFSDLDGVWFDEENNFARPNPILTESISRAREQGFWVVLTSDTAPTTLIQYAKELNATPWVIAEKGSVIYIPDMGYKILSKNSSVIPKIKQDIIQALQDRPNNARVWQGDATPFVQDNQTLPDLTTGQIVYLMNATRISSIGIYTRRVSEEGTFIIDDTETQNTKAILQNILDKYELTNTFQCKSYPTVGSCLIKDPTIKKSDAIKQIIETYGPTLSYWMIGDTQNDSMKALNGLVRVGAVGNAEKSLKEEAQENGIVAPRQNTNALGADFIIKTILKKEVT
jgi:hydroxymethylpyrimidine pyrophosphatase-like HAD family hydrolase